MSEAPWTKEQAEKWANELSAPKLMHFDIQANIAFNRQDAAMRALEKAAEVIEACETIYANDNNSNSSFWYRQGHASDTHQAKLLCVKPIEKGKSDE